MLSMSQPYKINARVHQNFSDWFRSIYPDAKGLSARNVTIGVTEDCTLRCTYCYQAHKNKKYISTEVTRKIVDSLFKDAEESDYLKIEESDAIILEFIGGEPFMAIDEINDFMEYFLFVAISKDHKWATNYVISITTNGTLYLTPKVQAFIDRFKDKISITITIDGNKQLHDACRVFPDGTGSYDIVEAAVKSHVSKFSNVNTKLTLAPDNIEYLVDAIKNLEDLGIRLIYANVVFEEGWENKHARVFYQELKKLADYFFTNYRYVTMFCSLFEEFIGKPSATSDDQNWCGGTGKMLAYDTQGKAYPCLRYMPFALESDRPDMSIGDVDSGISVKPNHQNIVKTLEVITRTSQSTDKCNTCQVGTGCAWCSAYHYDKFGDANKRATYICEMHQARVLANVYYWNTLYKMTHNEDLVFENNIPKEWALQIIDEAEFEMLNELTRR